MTPQQIKANAPEGAPKRLSDKVKITRDDINRQGLRTLLAYVNRKPDHKDKYIEL